MAHLEIMLCLIVEGLLGFRFDLFGRPRGVQPLNVGVGLVLVGVLQEEIVLGEVVLEVEARYSCIFKYLFSLSIQKITRLGQKENIAEVVLEAWNSCKFKDLFPFSINTIARLNHKKYYIKWVYKLICKIFELHVIFEVEA